MSTAAQSGHAPGTSKKAFQSQKECIHWKKGNCVFGSRCRFRHDPAVKGVVTNIDVEGAGVAGAVERSEPLTARSESNRIVGSANSATTVQTTHKASENGRSQSSQSQSGVCWAWRRGKCQRGTKCRYQHEERTHNKNSGKESASKTAREAEAELKVQQVISQIRAAKALEDERTAALLAQEAERRAMEEKQARIRAEAAEKSRLACERRDREKLLREERARRAEEEMRRREAERLKRERETEEAKKQLQLQREQDAAVVEQYLIQESSLVTFSAGLKIRNVVPGFELCKITVRNLPKDARRAEIADLFLLQGVDQSEFFISHIKPEPNGSTLEATVLANVHHGQLIAEGLEGIEFRDETLTFSVSSNEGPNSMDAYTNNLPFLHVIWNGPSSSVVATYPSLAVAREQARRLDRMTYRRQQIRAETIPGTCSVRIKGLSPNIFMETSDHTDLIGDAYVCIEPVSFDLEHSFTMIREHLSCAHGVRMDTFARLANGLGPDGEVKIKVCFDQWDSVKDAKLLVERLRTRSGPYYRAWFPPQPVKYTIKIPMHQYEAQKPQWNALSERKKDVGAYVMPRIGKQGDIVFIQVMGQDKKAIGILKVRVECLASGEKLNSTYWHSSFGSNQAKAFFNRLYTEKKVFVRTDFKTRSLRISGDQHMVQEARQMIKDEVERLAQREVSTFIDRGLVGYFVREGLQKLKELLGDDNVQLDVNSRPCKIMVKGGEDATHHLHRLTEEARAASALGSILPGQIVEHDTCPVCYEDASNPEQLACGHVYCGVCLKHFLTSAVEGKSFPLTCAGNDATCNAPIAIPLIQRFLPPQVFHALVEAAFATHLEQRAEEFKYCTTPDCKQIYRRKADQASLQCPSCFSTICASCDEEGHEGMTCEERRIHKDPEEQERLNEQLAAESGYKKCPRCRIWIEKTEGCNHMACRCGVHICWKCMATFDTGNLVYDHLHAVHGNIHDEVPAGVQMGNMAQPAFLAGQADELARIEREAAARLAARQNGWGMDGNPFHRPRVGAAMAHPPPAPARAREPAPRYPDIMAYYQERRREQQAAEEEEAQRQAQELAHRQAREQQRREQDRGWCVVM
ncbi:hypothetical protein CVT26_003073 [Gymnopilus dilepis]|uniref:Uncharacterized protein n=1 Tax=Gymnopilus dilepis TaxID=231916 RepID=A0A409Y4X6_9AGAR|nr:hypothetical protein CVT26_003073 [Gymnopilus dilepis]